MSAGVSLVGATTYLIARRYSIKIVRQSEAEAANETLSDDELEDVYDEIYGSSRGIDDFAQKRSKRALRDRDSPNMVPPLITVAELIERAQDLAQQKASQRKVKLYFDSNDEYIMEDVVPELQIHKKFISEREQSDYLTQYEIEEYEARVME